MAFPTVTSDAALPGRPTLGRRAAGGRRRSGARRSEAGFTLAGLIVIFTIMAIFVAYTVPRQWSKILQREREKQTIYVMKQYARAIDEWGKKHGGNPVKLDQLKEARLPRVLRAGPKGELVDPLTGQMDWILVPPNAMTSGPGLPGTGGSGPGLTGTAPNTDTSSSGTSTTGTSTTGATDTTGSTSTTGTQASTSTGAVQFNAAASPKDYVGPFVGVRPPISGQSIILFNGATDYSQWHYTTLDLQQEVALETAPNPNLH